MKSVTYYTSGSFVAFRFDCVTQVVTRVCCRSTSPSIGLVGWGDLPLWDPSTEEEFLAIKEMALMALELTDAEASHMAQIAEYEAVNNFLPF